MGDKSTRWAVGVFGEGVVSGQWPSGGKARAVAVLGDSTFDMRGSTDAEGEISIGAVAVFGTVRVMVPVGTRVEMSGLALFGSKRSEVGDPSVAGPIARVKAWALFGSVIVT